MSSKELRQEELERLRTEVERCQKQIIRHIGEINQLRYDLGVAKDDNKRLRTLIDTHNDECRECPVIEVVGAVPVAREPRDYFDSEAADNA